MKREEEAEEDEVEEEEEEEEEAIESDTACNFQGQKTKPKVRQMPLKKVAIKVND